MNGVLTLGAAALLGLGASGHCMIMCGGITSALGMAAAKDSRGRTQPALLIGYQIGRVGAYALAGLMLAGAFGGLIRLVDGESVSLALRALSGSALLLAALVAFGRLRDPGSGVANIFWRRLAPLGRRLLPVTTLPRAFAFGMVWGWMPCGFVYSVLLLATLQLDALDGASTMAAFGLGTVPAMLITAFGAQRFRGFAALRSTRHVAGSLLLISATLTLAGPWVEHALPGLHPWVPFLCGVGRSP